MYIVIYTPPTPEQISAYGIKEVQEDAFTDFKIELDTLSDAQKQHLCDLFGVVPETLAGQKSLTLSLPSEV